MQSQTYVQQAGYRVVIHNIQWRPMQQVWVGWIEALEGSWLEGLLQACDCVIV